MAWVTDNGEIHREISPREAFGRTCLAAGDYDRAEEQFRRALDLAERCGLHYIAAQTRLGLARIVEPLSPALQADG